ncbi:fam71d: putative protein [Crotalus adamanteus]|uniref:Golgi associated RAB2 interactor protein-like Rab2B-binding domain-containing protein n=1 Tax=Crotalus adamanteus TaxID=8729 RepID=A0AAW1C5S1_CROAD
MGDLQKVLDRGEYIPLKSAPVFESKFVQGIGLIGLDEKKIMQCYRLRSQETTIAEGTIFHFYATSSGKKGKERKMFLPLQFVDLSVHSANKRRLKLKLVNGRAYYLELCAPAQKQSEIFSQWVRLINLLKSKSEGPSINTLYKDFETQEDNKAIRNKTRIQGKNTIEPLKNPSANQESTELSKKASSKRVTYSDVVGSIEEFQNKSQTIVSSDSYMKQPHANSRKEFVLEFETARYESFSPISTNGLILQSNAKSFCPNAAYLK